MDRNHIKGVLTTLSLCLVLLLAIGAASYAWFINNGEAGIRTDDNVAITVDNRLEIRPYVSNQDKEAGWGADYQTSFTGSFPDITGDGVNFYFPTSLDDADQPYYDKPSETFVCLNGRADLDLFFMTLKVEFRSRTPMDVYLADDSSVLGVDIDKIDDLTQSVSSDLIAGAVRVGFYELTKNEDGQAVEVLKTVWIPNDSYHLIDLGDGSYTFKTDGDEAETYGYLAPNNGTLENSTYMEECTWSEADYDSGAVLVGHDRLAKASTATAPSTANNSVPLLSLDGREAKVLIIRIWVEGTDREAVSTLNGGQMKYDLNFIGIMPTETENDPE